MAYVGGPYGYDVFFSYAHGGDSKLGVWSRTIPDELRQELHTSLSVKDGVEIFQDRDLDRSGAFAGELEQAARGAAVLLIVLTDHYLTSDWCSKERDWFVQACQARGLTSEPIYFVKARPTDRKAWPNELKARTPYSFHDESASLKAENVRPFGWFETTKGHFEEAVVRLAGDISRRLKVLRQQNDALQAAQSGFGKLDKQAVYLHARPGDAAAWSGARNDLRHHGLVVFPGEPPVSVSDPAAREAERRKQVELCAECDALLLLRPSDGSWLEAELARIGLGFRREVQRCRRARIPVAVLDLVDQLGQRDQRHELAEDLDVSWLPARQASIVASVATWLTALRESPGGAA